MKNVEENEYDTLFISLNFIYYIKLIIEFIQVLTIEPSNSYYKIYKYSYENIFNVSNLS